MIGSFRHQRHGLKGGLESKDTHYFGLGSHIFRSFSSIIDSPHFGDKKKKFTIHYHYSSVTIHDTVHSEFLPILGGLSLMFEASFSSDLLL